MKDEGGEGAWRPSPDLKIYRVLFLSACDCSFGLRCAVDMYIETWSQWQCVNAANSQPIPGAVGVIRLRAAPY
jgi:hypothetical protein